MTGSPRTSWVTVPASADALPLIRDAVTRLGPDDVPIADRGRFETAVFALTAEIIERAGTRDSRARVVIDLTLRYEATGFTAQLDENGAAWADESDLPAQEIADEVRYARSAERNRWVITCALSHP